MVNDNENIEIAFEEAVELATRTSKKLPPDIRLALYARYKHATRRNHVVSFEQLADNDLRGAFKYNAMIQVRNLTIEEAKTEYIELVNLHIKD